MFEKLRAQLAYSLAPKVRSGMSNTVINDTLIGITNVNPPKRGTQELLNLYSESPWLRAVVNKIGYTVGDTTWRLYVAKDSNGKTIKDNSYSRFNKYQRDKEFKKAFDINKVKEISNHPLLDLLQYGNQHLLGRTVIQLTAQYLDLVGEAYWVLERNAVGTPVAIWPVPPSWVRRLPSGDFPYYAIHGRYGTLDVNVPESEVIVFKEVDPANPYRRGTGVANALSDDLEIDEYTQKHLKAFFYNRAKPDIIISGDNIGRDDTVRLEEKWLEKHQGFMSAFKPMFLSKKVDVKELQQNLEHQQIVQLRTLERDVVIQTFGCPPEMFGVIGDSKRATISAADMFFSKHVITPRAELICATLQRELVPEFDEKLILDFDSPIQEDKDFVLEVMKSQTAAFTLDDWRDLASRERFGPKGKVVLVPVNQDIIAVSDLKDPDARQSARIGTNTGSTDSAANNNGVSSKDLDDEFNEYVITAKELSSALESGSAIPKPLLDKVKLLLHKD